ncbi:MAG: protein kinase [Blastocatellia bacterium]|nr:protein kinase [Blastocatellia bacterium]
MDAERWAKIDRLLDEAMDRDPRSRTTFLDEACAGDEELRREVESLLEAHSQSEPFLSTPALDVVARHLAGEKNISLVGKQFGAYQVLSAIGAGGMGEVYLARDERLRRKLALKLLPKRFTQDTDRVRRFEQEARAASALNHPNIITIYDMGEMAETYFIASEYVEGRTLRQLIERGPLRTKEAMDICVQVADALAAAHEAGLVHRDIKPENVIVRPDGYVKVLDFGLVKLTERGLPERESGSSDLDKTNPGIVLGTVAYMSPEQAEGLEVDHRSDLFSLGVLMYELLTGVLPFKGDSTPSILNAIIYHQPASLSSLNVNVNAEMERIVNRALEKDRDLRYQTASDLRAVLRRLQKSIDSQATASGEAITAAGVKAAERFVNHWWMKAAIIATAFALLSTMAWLFFPRTAGKPNGVDWSEARAEKITDQAGPEIFPSLSPDGKSLVYASRLGGNYDIYYKRIGTKKTINLTEGSPDDDSQPAFSPDGTRIAFRSSRKGGGIFVMSETGESVRQLTNFGFNPAWSPDGREIACAENSVTTNTRTKIPSRMWVVDATTGESRLLLEGDAVQPSWSPDGNRIAFWGVHKGTQRDIWTMPASGGDAVLVTDDASVDFNPVWSPDGKHLYFISSRRGTFSLWRVPIDGASGKTLAEPELVPLPSARSRNISFSRDGKRMAFLQVSANQNAYRLSFDPVTEKIIGQPEAVTRGSTPVSAPAISPDGTLLAYTMSRVKSDIYLLKQGHSIPDQITEGSGTHLVPRWSPDGKHILFYSNPTGSYQIYSIKSDGSGRQQLTDVASPGAVYGIMSPVGNRLAYSFFSGKTVLIDLSKPFKDQTPLETPLFPGSSNHFVAWDWSPDGKYLVGSRTGGGGSVPGIHIYSLESQQYERISDIGAHSVWLNDNRRLVFTTGSSLYIIDRLTKKPRELWSFSPNAISRPSITRDNRSIYLALTIAEADIWILSLE